MASKQSVVLRCPSNTPVNSIVFVDNEPLLISGHGDGSIIVWQLKVRRIVSFVVAHAGVPVLHLELVPERIQKFERKQVLVSQGRNGLIQFWDLTNIQHGLQESDRLFAFNTSCEGFCKLSFGTILNDASINEAEANTASGRLDENTTEGLTESKLDSVLRGNAPHSRNSLHTPSDVTTTSPANSSGSEQPAEEMNIDATTVHSPLSNEGNTVTEGSIELSNSAISNQLVANESNIGPENSIEPSNAANTLHSNMFLIIPDESLNFINLWKLNSECITPSRKLEPKAASKTGMCMALTATTIPTTGECIVFGLYENGYCFAWSVQNPDRETSIQMHNGVGLSILVDIDARHPTTIRGITGGVDGTLSAFAFKSSKFEFKIVKQFAVNEVHQDNVSESKSGISSLCLRQDRKLLAVGSWDKKTRVYSWKTLTLLSAFDNHQTSVSVVAYSENLLYSASEGRIRCW